MGTRARPVALPLAAERKPVIAAVISFAIFYFAHPWITGMALTWT